MAKAVFTPNSPVNIVHEDTASGDEISLSIPYHLPLTEVVAGVQAILQQVEETDWPVA